MIYPNMKRALLYILLSLFSTSLDLVSAHDNGMDMSTDGAMDLASGNMLTYLHFTSGDILWFQGWVPSKAGPMVGACIGLFLLAVFDRWVSAYRGLIDSHWYRQAKINLAKKTDANNSNTTAPRPQLEARPSVSSESSIAAAKLIATAPLDLPDDSTQRKTTPLQSSWFIRDVPRGIVQAAQSALEFAFMLVVMTFQAGFIISVVVGLGVGEAMFGRYHPQAHLYH
ncbi:hypothetical protein ACEPAF_3095 [Sanghuangporus sanghuang]